MVYINLDAFALRGRRDGVTFLNLNLTLNLGASADEEDYG
jgi:hypothetical protein